MKINAPEKNLFGPSNWELYKQLEIHNFIEMCTENPKIKKRKNPRSVVKHGHKHEKNAWTVKSVISKPSCGNQRDNFLKSMRMIIVLGQCLGLNPAMGILQKDYRKMRFKFFYWKFLYSIFLCSFQVLGTTLCVYRMCVNAISIKILAFVSFYASTGINTILFVAIAKKWPRVIRKITNSQLDEYVDARLKIRCTVTTITFLMLASIEYALAQIAKYARILDCTPSAMITDVYKILSEFNYNWLFDTGGASYSLPLGILIQILNIITTINWSYSDMFITCVSLYLISIFDKLNEKIDSAQSKSFQPWFWRSVREDYTRATQLVRLFDDVIGGITFVSFSNHLFFICLQIYNVLQNGISAKRRLPLKDCPNHPSGPFNGYEYPIYFTFSIFLIISRFLAVSLLASRVHSAAVQPSTALHGVPTQFYCTEIQRFIEQIHSDDVALSGLQFFHITRSLILSVAGTIVTYELVLLQFDDDD